MPLKPKVKPTPVKPKEAIDTKEGITPGPSSASSEPSYDPDHLAADHVENGHEPGTAAFEDVGSAEDADGHSEAVVVATHDPAADEDAHSDLGVHPEQQDCEHPTEEEAHSHNHVAENVPEESPREHKQTHLEVYEDTVPEPTESHTGQVISNGNGNSLKVEHTAPGNDIEDIVNLLEGASPSKPRPQSIVSIPDEDGEILNEY